jgi:hypothetical protein
MSWPRKLTTGFVLLSLVLLVKATPFVNSNEKFDEVGDVGCEAEMAHLDNFAIQLQNDPAAKGVIIFYGGKTFRGKLPKRGLAAARAARMKPYLVDRRGIPAEQVIVIDGGYRAKWTAEFWVVPSGATMPAPSPTVPARKIRFRKGKVNPRDYRCGV